MIAQKLHQFLSLNKHNLGIVQQFCRDFVGSSRHRSPKSQDLSRSGDAEHQSFPILRTDRELRSSITQNEYPPRRPAFRKQQSALRLRAQRLYTVERLQRIQGHITELPVRPEIT